MHAVLLIVEIMSLQCMALHVSESYLPNITYGTARLPMLVSILTKPGDPSSMPKINSMI